MVEIMTDKATVEIPAPRAGRVAKRMYAEGQICPVGKVLITIEVADGGRQATPAAAAGRRRAPTRRPRPSAGERAPRNNGVNARDAGVLATPATRKLARDLDVDIREVPAPGRAGGSPRTTCAAHAGAAPPRRRRRRRGGRADDVASRSGACAGRSPSTWCTRSTRRRTSPTSRRSTAPTWSRCATRANARAGGGTAGESASCRSCRSSSRRRRRRWRSFPQLNATLDDAAGEIIQRAHRHIGLATATEAGLIVPVVRDADRLSIVELAGEIERLAALTRTGKAAREDLSGSTFTITSLGALGGLLATPIINHPEVAILGVHKITKPPGRHGTTRSSSATS